MKNIFLVYQNLKLKHKLIFLFSIVCLIILAVFSSISLTIYKSLIIKNESRAMLENLDFFKANLDNYLENIDTFTTAAIYSRNIQNNIRVDLDTLESEARIQAFNEIYGKLYEISNITFGIRSIFLIDKHNNTFSIDIDMDTIYRLMKNGNLNEHYWYKQVVELSGLPYWVILDKSNGEKYVGMFRVIKDMNNIYGNSELGIFMLTISPKILENFFSRNRISEGVYCILDSNNTIYSNSKTSDVGNIINTDFMEKREGYYIENVKDKSYVVTYSYHPMTKWTLIHIIDRNYLLRDVKYINNVWVFTMVLSFILVIFISLFISNSVSKPLNRLVILHKEVEKGNLNVRFNNLYTDEIGILGSSFNNMVDKIREGIPLKREKFLRSLLVGNLTEKEYAEAERDIGISFRNINYQVVIICVEGMISNEMNKDIENIMAKYENKESNIISMTLKNGEYCVISNQSEEQTYAVIKEIVKEIKESFNINVDAFSGNNYDSLHFVKNSFEEARELIKYKLFKNPELDCINHEFVISNSWEFAYPDNFENRLFYYIEQDDFDGCKKVIKESIEFFKNNNTDPLIIYTFIQNIYIHLYKMTIKNGIPAHEIFGKELYNLNSLQYTSQPVENILDSLIDTIRVCIDITKDSIKENISLSIKKAIEIIKNEFSNPQLGVEYVAGKVHLNENYFCRLFKKEIGISFVDYVSKLRLEKAQELLKESTIKIKDISERVGFSNPHYFGIWFKENTGVTPSQYRKYKN
ncbi:MAG TPA: helix-turn-helix domain-containing protein, partial [Clostridiales bacterium]|nr:helix-turn-helix domain-containing protein [Clostridiales bacterium]